MKKISLIFGTRPEAIKLAPLILALRDHPTVSPYACVTGQHREMLGQVLQVFQIEPDVDLLRCVSLQKQPLPIFRFSYEQFRRALGPFCWAAE